jgi:hypothetical protein
MSDAPFDETLLEEACAAAFAPLPRSDQRECGAQFVRGLLTVRGRKSIRNVAAVVGGRSAYQRLHHFVSASTWDWTAVRRAAAGYLDRMAPPEMWVLQQAVIQKSGLNIGAERRSRETGRVRYTQRALSLWGVSRTVVCPVDWQLDVPHDRLKGDDRSNQPSTSSGIGTQSALDSALRLCREAPRAWGLPIRPVVMDARDLHAEQLARGLLQAEVPFLLRIGGDLSVICDDPALPAEEQPVGAAALLAGARRLQRPAGPTLAATVRVTTPSADGRRNGLTLLGVAEGRSWPAQLWLSDRRDVPLGRMLRWTRLLCRLDHELTGPAPRTGLYDFSGRSFGGWHRHMTLVSVAQLVAGLCRSELGPGCEAVA